MFRIEFNLNQKTTDSIWDEKVCCLTFKIINSRKKESLRGGAKNYLVSVSTQSMKTHISSYISSKFNEMPQRKKAYEM